MSFLDTITRAKAYLEQQGRVSLRALRREFALDDDALDELVEELVDVQQVAVREGTVLVSTAVGSRQSGVGSSAGPEAAISETRKVITVIFADLMGSTALQEGLDPESVNRVMDAYYEAVREPVEAAGGTVVQLLGDGVFCAFGIPRIAEDDALRAVRAAVGIQTAFREFLRAQQGLRATIGLRVAVNTGEVVVSAEHPAGIGDPLNVAARLQQEARDGEVLIGQATRRLVSHAVTLEQAGVFALKGRSETVTAYRVVSLERPTATTAAFVGRESELSRLIAVYERAVAKPAAALSVVLGSPGLGKSRLIGELTQRLGDGATVLTAQCDAAGGATFAPMASALRPHVGRSDVGATHASPLPDADRTRIVAGIDALLAGSPASPEETFFVIRRFLTALAHEKPVVLVIDDLHWAEPLLLDLVEHLIQWGSGVPLFVVAGARPELHDLRSSLVTAGGFVADVVTLTGLDAGAAMRLAANAIGAADLPAAVAAKVLATSEGNPLFVSELVRMLVQEGALAKEGDRWIVGANLASFEMPPTIHALLAARIERLRLEERTVLEHASVVGRYFSRGAVAALSSVNGNDLDARLEALRRTELIEPDTGWFLGEPVLRFHHVLIRDAAYRRLLKGTRAELHQRLADWIESKPADAAEHDETIGWHLEQAYQHLRELGPIAAKGKALGERASRRLAAAGRRALAGDDVASAGGLLGRAIGCLADDDPARAELALDWCEALLSAGDVGAAAEAIGELGRFTSDTGLGGYGVTGLRDAEESTVTPNPITPNPLRLQAWRTCFTGQLTALTEPQKLQATADAVAAAAEELATLHDDAGEAKAHSVHAQALARLGKVGACEAALDKALAAARKAGDRRRANAVLAGAPVAALWGPSPVTRASGRCLDVVRVLRITQGAPAVEAVALSCQGVLEALRGRTDAARRMIASSRTMVEELGIAHRLFEADVFAGRIDLLEGDAAAAERHLRGAYEGLRDLGLGIDAARAGAMLARARLAQGAGDEAESLSHESEALAGDDLQAAIAWRGVRAEALARRGDSGAAIELAQAAVTIASATDALLDHADACLALAATLRAAGRHGDADIEERHAIELWEAKGASLLAERARRNETANDGGRSAATPPSADTAAAGSQRSPLQSQLRRVLPNHATTRLQRFDQVVAARDADGLAEILSEQFALTHHVTGLTYGRRGMLTTWRSLFRAQRLAYRYEVLATLGDSLLLHRHWVNAEGFAEEHLKSAGAIELEEICFTELDHDGRALRFELFAFDHLGDAIARLYSRYAELQPDDRSVRDFGAHAVSARTRAATTAAAVGAMLTRAPDRRLEDIMVPDLEVVDHRTVGIGPAQGSQVFPRWRAASDELADDQSFRIDDILALAPNALLRRTTQSGTVRASGGIFETTSWALSVFGADGRQTRFELFDVGHETDALARFDALTADSTKPIVRRRVRSNAASMGMARVQAALDAHDFDTFAAVSGDPYEEVHHPTGATYTRAAMLASVERFLRLPGATVRQEHLATLGDTLLLHRRWMGASAAGRTHFDVGEFEKVEVGIVESDGTGSSVRHEIFAADRLGDAIVRLYERYAELLPQGAARTRAAATVRAVAAMVAPPDLGRYASALAPDVEFVDHRTVGFASGRGADKLLRGFTSLLELADNVTTQVDDVLALEPGAMLLRWMTAGTDRASGGTFESSFLLLWTFGGDGLVARDETFDAHRDTEALARFDVLTAAAPKPARRRVRPNRASAAVARFDGACAAFDLDAAAAVMSDDYQEIDHPTGSVIHKIGVLESMRSPLRAPKPRLSHEVLATLGESLMLGRRSTSAGGGASDRFDVGTWEREEVGIVAVDPDARLVAGEIFAADHLGDAIVRLYELYAEQLPEGPARTRASVTARAAAYILTNSTTPDESVFFSATYEDVDHRTVGYGEISTEQAQKLAASFRALADAVRFRVDEVLALRPDGFVRVTTTSGVWRDGGGAFERTVCMLTVFGPDGRTARQETFDSDRTVAALARFDELVLGNVEGLVVGGGTESKLFANAASRADARLFDCFNARDWPGIEALAAPELVFDERRRLLRNTCGRALWLEQLRILFDVPASRFTTQLRATRGERLALSLHRFTGEVADGGGPLALSGHLALHEVDDDGRIVAIVLFDLEDEAAAYAELDARAILHRDQRVGNAATRARERVDAAFLAQDWHALRALAADTMVYEDRRHWSKINGDAALWLKSAKAIGSASEVKFRDTIITTAGERIELRRRIMTGIGPDGGDAFESEFLLLTEIDADGKITASINFDVEARKEAIDEMQRRSALARAGRKSISSPVRFANAATRLNEAVVQAWERRDWNALLALHDPQHHTDDRRRLMHLRIPAGQHLVQLRMLFDVPHSRFEITTIATRGERLVLSLLLFAGQVDDQGGALAIDLLEVVEVDAEGRLVELVLFDPDDLDAAYAELDARWLAGDGAAHETASTRWAQRFGPALQRRDWEAVAAVYSPSYVGYDHRLAGWGTHDRAVLLKGLQEMVALAPDAHMRPDHIRTTPRGFISDAVWVGTREGGAFESPFIVVTELDADGLIQRQDFYDPQHLAEAQARFAEVSSAE